MTVRDVHCAGVRMAKARARLHGFAQLRPCPVGPRLRRSIPFSTGLMRRRPSQAPTRRLAQRPRAVYGPGCPATSGRVGRWRRFWGGRFDRIPKRRALPVSVARQVHPTSRYLLSALPPGQRLDANKKGRIVDAALAGVGAVMRRRPACQNVAPVAPVTRVKVSVTDSWALATPSETRMV